MSTRQFAASLTACVLVSSVVVSAAPAKPDKVGVGQSARLSLTGAPAETFEVCGRRRRVRLAAAGADVRARILIVEARGLRRARRRARIVVDRCQSGRWRRVSSERLAGAGRYRRVRRYRRTVDTSRPGDLRLRVRVAGDRRRRPTRSRFAYLRVEAGEIVELPLRFRVKNVNRSQVPCASDGAEYEIVGSLVGPQARLDAPERAVTLYLHGAAGDYWQFRAVPGYDFATELARAGHSSVVIDRLGYNRSSQPNGLDLCTGAQADIAHQVIQALRTGDYTIGGGPGHRFRRVALAGHSAGAQIANVEAYSFGDIDALVSMAWADQGQSQPGGMEAAKTGLVCAGGGQEKKPGGPGGYAYVGQTPEDFRSLVFYNFDPAVFDAAVAVRERDPCGELSSVPLAIVADHARLGDVRVPVLLVFGDHDGFYPPPAGRQQKDLFTGSSDVTLLELANTGHALFLERTGSELRLKVSDWLAKHGL